MISLAALLESGLNEKTGEQLLGSKVAKQLGLIYKKFGRWADPKEPNKIVAKTIDGKLVKLDTPEDDPGEPRAHTKPDGSPDYEANGRSSDTARRDRSSMGKAVRDMEKSPTPPPAAKKRAKVENDIFGKIEKNLDKLSQNPKLLDAASSKMKKVLSRVPNVDPEFLDSLSPEKLLVSKQLVDTSMNPDGTFSLEYESIPRNRRNSYPSDVNPPSTYSQTRTADFDSLEDALNGVDIERDPRTKELRWNVSVDD